MVRRARARRSEGRRVERGSSFAKGSKNLGRAHDKGVVFTIGHSTRLLETFIEMSRSHGIQRIVDVRTVPRSRHNAQFNRETLPEALQAASIGYTHMAGLGGLRRPRRDSPNTGWRNPGFRGYADYAMTAEFEASLKVLIELASRERVAVMCAEAVPWRCHRSLISDALVVRGVRVEHIFGPARAERHVLTPWAQVEGTCLTYPPETLPLEFDSKQRQGRGE